MTGTIFNDGVDDMDARWGKLDSTFIKVLWQIEQKSERVFARCNNRAGRESPGSAAKCGGGPADHRKMMYSIPRMPAQRSTDSATISSNAGPAGNFSVAAAVRAATA
jgi:hypothetical protein